MQDEEADEEKCELPLNQINFRTQKCLLLLCVSGKAKAEVGGGETAATTSSASSSSSSVTMQDFELLKVLGTGGECSSIGIYSVFESFEDTAN